MQYSKSYYNVKAYSLVIKCNYSERLNSPREQTCNVHLCRHLAMGESLFEPIPLQIDWHGLEVLLMVQCLFHFQPLAHNTILTEPTHSHLFIFCNT